MFSNNPYRVLGVLSSSGIKELKKNLSKLNAFAKIGKEMKLDYDFSFFNLAELKRTDDFLLKSENHLILDINKIKSSLFWFSDLSPVDSVAIANLVRGDLEKVREIWEKATKSKKVTAKNYSSFSNYSSFLLINSLDDSKQDLFKNDKKSISDLKLAIQLKLDFIKSDFFDNYNDEIIKTKVLTSFEIEEYFTETILTNLKKSFNKKELFKLFDGFDGSINDKLNASLTDEPIQNINNQIENALDLLQEDIQLNISNDKKGSSKGIEFGVKLIKDTKEDFNYLKDIFSSDDFQFQIVSDKLSNAILECGIACFNSNIDNSHYQTYYDSFKYSLEVAIGDKTITRAEKAVKHCEDEASANICEFCKTKDVTTSFRIKMHKMKYDNSYSYFPDGGIELPCCNTCKSEKNQKKYLSWGLAGVVYVGLNALVMGGIFFIDILYGRFKITKWWFKFVSKKMFYKNVKSHSITRMLEIDNYEYGMP